MKTKKYIFESALASFAIPIVMACVIFSVGFGPPESDSGAVQGFVFTLLSFPFIFLFQLLAYYLLGRYQIKRPSLSLGAIVAALLSAPFLFLGCYIGLMSGGSAFESILGALLWGFLPLWSSFFLGAYVQVSFIKKHNKLNQPGTPQSGAPV